VSTAEQINGGSLAEQRRKVEAVATLRDGAVVEVFEDRGVSGTRPLAERQAGGRLLATARAGDTIITSKLDRWARSAEDALATVRQLRERGIEFISADISNDPLTENGVGKLFLTIMAAVSEFERDRLRERQAEGQADKKGRGGHIGGSAPFGWRVEGKGKAAQLVPVPEQQVAIKAMRELRAAGLSLRAIAAEVERRHGFKVSRMAVATALR
jgi:DNA invertase Pin-like site-specific DNA recombinase